MRKWHRTSTLAMLTAALMCGPAARAGILGSVDFGTVAIYDDYSSSSNDHFDAFRTHDNTFFNAPVTLKGSAGQTASSVTDSERPGLLYAVSTAGQVWAVDWYRGTTTQIADLDPPASSSGHTLYDSITNYPGRDELYIHRTGTTGSENKDYVDIFNPATGQYVPEAFIAGLATGGKTITDGPDYDFGSGPEPAVYTMATGGAYGVHQLSNPGTPGSPTVSVNLDGGVYGAAGTYESMTGVPADPGRIYIVKDTTPTSPSTLDTISIYDTAGSVTPDWYTTVHSAASFITDSPRPGWVFSGARGGTVAHLDVTAADPAATAFEEASNVQTSFQSATNVAVSPPKRFVYIADDGDNDTIAGHADVFDTQYNWLGGFADNVYSAAATTTGVPDPDNDYQDTAVTDAFDPAARKHYVWQLHTDGQLFKIDPDTGAGGAAPAATLSAPANDSQQTFDAVTNVPGTTKLFILRTDRPTDLLTGGASADRIDVYDFATDTYTANVYTTSGGGPIDISDGPDYDFGSGPTPAVYIVATGGNFEAFDAFGTTQQVISTGMTGLGSGALMSLTNLMGDPDTLYILQDRTSSSDRDRVHAFHIDGSRSADLFALAMSGAQSITDTYEHDLFAVARGGTHALIDIDVDSLGQFLGGTVYDLSTDGGTRVSSVTNLGNIPEPATMGLLGLGALALLRRRRKDK